MITAFSTNQNRKHYSDDKKGNRNQKNNQLHSSSQYYAHKLAAKVPPKAM